MIGKKIAASLLFCGLLGAVLPVPAFASTGTMSAVPTGLYSFGPQPFNPSTIPLLAEVQKSGGQVYYLGERSGLTGWLIVKNGQIQMVYATPDRHTLVMGALLTDAGDTITTQQIERLAETNKALADILHPAAQQQRDAVVAGAVVGGVASLPSDYQAAQTIGNVLPAVSLSPGERLMMDLRAAAGVTAGPSGKPELFMLVDSKCAQCSDIWQALKEPITEGTLQLHIIPTTVGVGKPDDVRSMAMLLQTKNPVDAWAKFVGGDAAALAGTPDTLQVRAVGANRAMMDRWSIQVVPYLVYRSAQDHAIKIVQGKPNRMASILAGILGH